MRGRGRDRTSWLDAQLEQGEGEEEKAEVKVVTSLPFTRTWLGPASPRPESQCVTGATLQETDLFTVHLTHHKHNGHTL